MIGCYSLQGRTVTAANRASWTRYDSDISHSTTDLMIDTYYQFYNQKILRKRKEKKNEKGVNKF